MLYKAPGLAAEMLRAHPVLRGLNPALDEQLKKRGLPELVITAVGRDPSFYLDKRFSWHFCFCAEDIRTREYTAETKAWMVAWLQGRLSHSEFKCDVVLESDHIHVEVEDWLRRREWEKSQRATV